MIKLLKKVGAILLLILTFSCQKQENDPKKSARPLRLNFSYTPFALDPRRETEPLTATFHAMLYEGLTHLEPDGSVSLALAATVSISPDKKTYYFKLKKSFWSDGTPLTARDFEWSWKGALDPHFPSKAAHLFYPIKNAERAKRGECSLDEVGVKALSSDSLVVELSHETPYFLELTSSCTYLPVSSAHQSSLIALRPSSFVSNGPFTLKEWRSRHEIKLKKNPYFWDQQAVNLSKIKISIVPDEGAALELFNRQEIDWIGGMISPLSPEVMPHLVKEGKVLTEPIAGTTFCCFNLNRPPFDNANIRKAFSYAIDREALVNHITQMPDKVATSFIPAPLKGSPQALFFPLNQRKRARLFFLEGLCELGIEKEALSPITYNYFQSDIHQKLALALQSQWLETLGIWVKLCALPIQDHFALLSRRNFQCAQLSWIAQYLDPMNFLERLKSSESKRNYSGWNHPSFDLLLSKSHEVEGKEREELLNRAEKLVMEELPIVPFYHYPLIYLQNPQLKGVEISPVGSLDFRRAYFDPCAPVLCDQ